MRIRLYNSTPLNPLLESIEPSEYFRVLGEFTSYAFEFTYMDKVEEFISSFSVCSDAMVEFIAAKPCTKGE